VSIRAETNLKLAVFYLRHQDRISRIVAPASVALTVVRSLRSTKYYEENFKVAAEQPVINEKDWPRTMEAVCEFFGSVLGETGVPLAYVIRENCELSPGTDPSEWYITVAEEIIERAPHGSQAYANDSGVTWQISPEIMIVGPMSNQHNVLKMRDALSSCYGITSSEASEAEAKLGLVSYTGERKKWTLEKYMQIHAEQHAVLNALTDYGHSGIDNGTKVRKLMAGIKTDALDTVKSALLASPALRINYPDFVTLYGDFIKQQNITRRHNGPASVAGSDYKAYYDGVVEDRFYNHAGYRTLSPDQKKELRLKRKLRGGDGNDRNKGNDRRSNGKSIREGEWKKDKKTIKSLTRTISALYCNTDYPESSSEETSVASEASDPLVKSNRTNSRLTHQRGSRK
jgi:hypothetical protein